MEINQTIKVFTKYYEIKEFTQGFIGKYHLDEYNLDLNLFFDEYKEFVGICINDNSKERLDIIQNHINNIQYSLYDFIPQFELKNINGITYLAELSSEESIFDNIDDISEDFLEAFEKEKGHLAKENILLFKSYYSDIAKSEFLSGSRSKIFDFSSESDYIANIIGRTINLHEYKYLSNELKNIINGYIEFERLSRM